MKVKTKLKVRSGHIFDIGANEGIDGLALALYNRDCLVHAFEPNPALIKTIKKNDYVIITAGLPFGHAKMTNMIRLYKVE